MITNTIELQDGFFIASNDIEANEIILTIPYENMPNRNDINKYPEILKYSDILNNVPNLDYMFVIIKNKLEKKSRKHNFFNNIEYLDDFRMHPLHHSNLENMDVFKVYPHLYHILINERKKLGVFVNVFLQIFNDLFNIKLDDDKIILLVNWAYIIMNIYSYENMLVPNINKFKINNGGIKFIQNSDGSLYLQNGGDIIKKGEYINIRRDYLDNKLNYVFYNQISSTNINFIRVSINTELKKSEAVSAVITPLIQKFKYDSFYFTNVGASKNLILYLRILSMQDYDITRLYVPNFFDKFVSLNNEHSIVSFLIEILKTINICYTDDYRQQINDSDLNDTIKQMWNYEYSVVKDMEIYIKQYWLNFLDL